MVCDWNRESNRRGGERKSTLNKNFSVDLAAFLIILSFDQNFAAVKDETKQLKVGLDVVLDPTVGRDC